MTTSRRLTNLRRRSGLASILLFMLVLPGCAGLSMLTHVLEEPYPSREVQLGTRGSVSCQEADGWELLAERRDLEAQWYFLQQVEMHPRAGEPLVGYALASAFLGDADETEHAVRQALIVDPRGVSIIVLEPRVRRRVQRLAGRWYEGQRCRPTADGVLVLGTLHLVLGDIEAAYYATEVSLHLGDRSPSVRALYRIVHASAPDLDVRPRRIEVVTRSAEAVREPSPPAPRSGGMIPRSSVLVDPPDDFDDPPPAREAAPSAPSGLQPRSTILGDPDATPGPPYAPPVDVDLDFDDEPEPEPVDYDALRDDIRGMSDALDRFAQKLLGRMADATSAY